MGDLITDNSMLISGDSLSTETINRGPLALLLRRQYEFPSVINTVQFLFLFFFQVDLLRKEYGLEIRTGFEYEFFIFKENTMEPLGKDSVGPQILDLRVMEKHHKLFVELAEVCKGLYNFFEFENQI